MAYLSYLYIIYGRGQAGGNQMSSLSRWQCLHKEIWMWMSSGDACIGALCLVQQNRAVDAVVHEL